MGAGIVGGFGFLMVLVYLGIIVIMISLALRFVQAVEKISDSIEKIAQEKSEDWPDKF